MTHKPIRCTVFAFALAALTFLLTPADPASAFYLKNESHVTVDVLSFGKQIVAIPGNQTCCHKVFYVWVGIYSGDALICTIPTVTDGTTIHITEDSSHRLHCSRDEIKNQCDTRPGCPQKLTSNAEGSARYEAGSITRNAWASQVRAGFADLDTDRDGRVTPKEYPHMVQALDADQDGVLVLDEAVRYAEQLFSDLDTDGNGTLEGAEIE